MNFRKLLNGAAAGEIIIPVLRSALFNPTFEGFQVDVRGFEPRPPDGWFHPSTHPTWNERQLYDYLVHPERIVDEPFDIHSTMAVTQGHFWHIFIEHIGLRIGLFRDTEVYVEDPELGSRGSMDAVISSEVAALDTDESFEFKTMRPSKVAKIERGRPDDVDVLDSFKAIAWDYVLQGQEYMRMSGYRKHRFLILSMEYPFEMREIEMPYDKTIALATADKYRRVRQAVADGRPPRCECPTKAVSGCPSRLMCAA